MQAVIPTEGRPWKKITTPGKNSKVSPPLKKLRPWKKFKHSTWTWLEGGRGSPSPQMHSQNMLRDSRLLLLLLLPAYFLPGVVFSRPRELFQGTYFFQYHPISEAFLSRTDCVVAKLLFVSARALFEVWFENMRIWKCESMRIWGKDTMVLWSYDTGRFCRNYAMILWDYEWKRYYICPCFAFLFVFDQHLYFSYCAASFSSFVFKYLSLRFLVYISFENCICLLSRFFFLTSFFLPSFFDPLHISFHAFARRPQDQSARALHYMTTEPGDHRTRGAEEHRTTEPEDRTRAPEDDQRTTGPEDHRSREAYSNCFSRRHGIVYFFQEHDFLPRERKSFFQCHPILACVSKQRNENERKTRWPMAWCFADVLMSPRNSLKLC